jgi:hypothetical protein
VIRQKFFAFVTTLLCAVVFVATPAQARFLQVDPVGYKDDIDLYTYVQNDPTNRIDPSGLSNINLFNQVSDNIAWQQTDQWNPTQYYSVSGHGDGKEVGGLTPQELKSQILADKAFHGQTIYIDACKAGQGPNSFAQQLANLMQTRVIAPTDNVEAHVTIDPKTGKVITWTTTVQNGGKIVVFSPQPKPQPKPMPHPEPKHQPTSPCHPGDKCPGHS